MTIDERRDMIEISDHCLLVVHLEMKKKDNRIGRGWYQREYYRFDEVRVQRFRDRMEENLSAINDVKIEGLNRLIGEAAEETLKAKYRRKEKSGGEKEQPWINEEIRRGIRERRNLNKTHRNCRNLQDKEEAWKSYVEQKEKVKRMIAEEMRIFEERMTRDIRNGDKRTLWERINKLRGREKKKKELRIYDEAGEELEGGRMREEIERFWQGVYKTHPNKMEEIWTEESRRTYERELEIRRGEEREEVNQERRIVLPRVVVDPYRNIKVMDVDIKKENVIRILRKMKNGRAGGVDGLKPEMYKVLEGSELFVRAMVMGLQRVIQTGEMPDSWKRSRTVLIPKKVRPTVEQLRPIAMTDISYKVLMGVLRDKIEEQIEGNGMRRDEQVGFTPGGMIADNLFMLQECVHEVFRRREEMVIVAIDFRKAYDSVKRERVLEILQEYRIEGRVIELFKRVYSEDGTRLVLGEQSEVEVEVESGIRQGCTASTVLFKLITFKIIEVLNRKLGGVSVGNVRLRSLFFGR